MDRSRKDKAQSPEHKALLNQICALSAEYQTLVDAARGAKKPKWVAPHRKLERAKCETIPSCLLFLPTSRSSAPKL
jgi:hypothetical protein